MAGLNSQVYKGVKRYWRRRGYRRLATTDELRSTRRRWSWKIRIPKRLKIKLNLRFRIRFRFRFNPKKMINRVNDAYVRMMMRVASVPAVSGGGMAGCGGGGGGEFGLRPVKEYDEKMIIEMYKALVARHAQLTVLDVGEPNQMASFK